MSLKLHQILDLCLSCFVAGVRDKELPQGLGLNERQYEVDKLMAITFTLRQISLFKAVSQVASTIVILVGCLVMIGWASDNPILKSVFLGLVAMKANTALSFILAGMSLWLLSTKRQSKSDSAKRYISLVCTCTVILVGALTLSEYLFGWDLGIDQLLFPGEPIGVGTLAPGRMAWNTALCFLSVGLALLVLNWQGLPRYSSKVHRWVEQLIQGLILGPILFPVTTILGYLYDIRILYETSTRTPMAVHTAPTFIILSIGIFCACPDRDFVKIILTDHAGGIMARRLLPAAITIPPVLGWVCWKGQQMGLYGAETGIAILITSIIVIFTILIWQNARSLNQIDTTRRRLEKKLLQSAAMVESSDDAIISKSLAGIITAWNPGAERLFGYTAAEAIGCPISILIPPDLTAQETEILARLRYEEHFLQFETVHMRKDGQRLDVSLTISPIKDVAGNITGAVKVARDITERKCSDSLVKETAAKLASSNEELSKFAYVASHDLRAPLRTITHRMKFLIKSLGTPTQDVQHQIERISLAIVRMDQLLNDLLAYSRVGTQRRELVPTDTQAVIQLVLDSLESQIQETQAQVQIQSDLPVVLADTTQLGQVFQNLISNGIKFCTAEPRIKIMASCQDQVCTFCVTDNGIGIPSKAKKQIFEVFQRLHNQSEYEGTGIGLSIVKKIIQQHGGRIWVESEIGEGSQFFFTLKEAMNAR